MRPVASSITDPGTSHRRPPTGCHHRGWRLMWSPSPPVLRPLGVGERLDASFKIFGRNFLAMAKAVLVIAIPASVLEVVITLSTALPQSTSTSSLFGTTNSVHRTASDLWTYSAGVFLNTVV